MWIADGRSRKVIEGEGLDRLAGGIALASRTGNELHRERGGWLAAGLLVVALALTFAAANVSYDYI